MEKGKFFYNEKTLRYERVEKDKKGLLINLAVLSLLLGLIAIVIYILSLDNFSFYQNKEQELSELKKTYSEMQQNLILMQKTLDNLHQRDSAIYKQILEQQPGEGEKSADKDFKTYSEEEITKMRPAELTGVLIERVKAMRKKTDGLKALKTDLKEALKTKEQMLKVIPSIRPVKSSNYRLEFISGFGYRKHPVFKILKMHKGIDFAAFEGTAVYATGHGKVQRVEFNKDGYGKCIVIDHGYDFQSVYAHLSAISIKVGQEVKRGQIIGRVGNSGGVSPHLHYEIIHKKKRINPIHFCREGMSPQEYSYFFEKAMVQNQALSIH